LTFKKKKFAVWILIVAFADAVAFLESVDAFLDTRFYNAQRKVPSKFSRTFSKLFLIGSVHSLILFTPLKTKSNAEIY